LPNGWEQGIHGHCSTQGTSTGGCPGLPFHTPQNIVKTKNQVFRFSIFCFWSNLYDVFKISPWTYWTIAPHTNSPPTQLSQKH
jgi:hypothetical protein